MHQFMPEAFQTTVLHIQSATMKRKLEVDLHSDRAVILIFNLVVLLAALPDCFRDR